MEAALSEGPWKNQAAGEPGRKILSRAELKIRLRLEPFGLTKKETEIALLILDGRKRGEILERCCIRNNTLKTHIRKIFRKFGVACREDIPGKVGLS